MRDRRHVPLLTGLVAALLVAACQEPPGQGTAAVNSSDHLKLWFNNQQCSPLKFTGGGRIDAPNPDQSGGAPPPYQPINGKTTFGFNIFLGTDANGNCVVIKSEIQVVHHEPVTPGQVTWHISVHDGANAIDGSPVPGFAFTNDRGGTCVHLGPTATRFHNVSAGTDGVEQDVFIACDNDRGQPQNSRTDSFEWFAQGFGDTNNTLLTGGNIVAH
jgi:hypothetical protein